jgi:hypothetical protein
MMMNKISTQSRVRMYLCVLFAWCLVSSCKGGIEAPPSQGVSEDTESQGGSEDTTSLCDRVHAKGVTLKVENAPTKELWDKSCSNFPRELLECAAGATTAKEFQKCGENVAPENVSTASPELCGRVYAKGIELKIEPFPEPEEWLTSCPGFPLSALECAAGAETADAFHQCGQSGTPDEGLTADKELCDRAYVRGLEFGLPTTASKEVWDLQCVVMPRAHITCAVDAKNVEEFLNCGK